MLTVAEHTGVVRSETSNGREWWGLPPKLQLLDRLMPKRDATQVVRRVIAAPQRVVYDATLDVDFLDALRHNFVVRSLFALRAAAEWLVSALHVKPYHSAQPPAPIRLRNLPTTGEWIVLGRDWPNEVAFGAIGRFWAGETRWIQTGAGDFAAFDKPGFAKIGCNIYLRALSGGRTLVTYEVRTKATDERSRRAFMRYWRVVAPFVALVMYSLLMAIERQAMASAKVP